ncbi:GNAT family N-acetyltransferase [Tessaracoccus terricola]
MTTITRFEQPASLDAPDAWVLHAEAEFWADVLREKVGSADLAETVPLLYSYGASPQYSRVIRLAASDGPGPVGVEDCTGVAVVHLPTADNLDVAEVSWVVRRGRLSEGIGTALHEAALEVGREHGRDKFWAFTAEPPELPAGTPTVAAHSGQGAVDATSRETRFLVDRGWRLNQVERTAMLVLPSAEDRVRERDRVRALTNPAYECVTFAGPVPEELLEPLAVLNTHMSTDVPTGEVEMVEVWDADRVRVMGDELALADREQLVTLVREVATGDFVGFTRFLKDRSVAELAHQWETLVIKGHRGHGLGMLAKVTNHAALATTWPSVARVSTGNAVENRHMLAINDALGFEPHGCEGFWVRDDGAHT